MVQFTKPSLSWTLLLGLEMVDLPLQLVIVLQKYRLKSTLFFRCQPRNLAGESPSATLTCGPKCSFFASISVFSLLSDLQQFHEQDWICKKVKSIYLLPKYFNSTQYTGYWFNFSDHNLFCLLFKVKLFLLSHFHHGRKLNNDTWQSQVTSQFLHQKSLYLPLIFMLW